MRDPALSGDLQLQSLTGFNRYNFTSLTGDFKKTKDGSPTFYIQNKSPAKDKDSNWLPSPTGDFWVLLCTYLPGEEIINQSWKMPDVEWVK